MLAQGDKKRALLALRRKKYQESLLSKTDAQLDQLEKLVNSVEFALISKDVVFGLEQGTKVLEQIHKEMGGIEHVEKLMGDTADAIAYQKVGFLMTRAGCSPGDVVDSLTWLSAGVQEISEMLGGSMSNQDEDEVEDELAALEEEVSRVTLPSAPRTKLSKPDTEADTEVEGVPAPARAEAARQAMLA